MIKRCHVENSVCLILYLWFRLVHKNVGADQCTNMLLKLEEDAEVAYNDYDKAVAAEDRAQNYVKRVR